jgi:hypothetical protein
VPTRSDHGPELLAQAIWAWLLADGAQMLNIEPGGRGRTATRSRCTASRGMSCWSGRSSPGSWKRGGSRRNGSTTTRSRLTVGWGVGCRRSSRHRVLGPTPRRYAAPRTYLMNVTNTTFAPGSPSVIASGREYSSSGNRASLSIALG